MEDKIIEIIADILFLDVKELKSNRAKLDELKLDSLDRAMIYLEIQSTFGIDLDVKKFGECKNFKTLVKFVQDGISQKGDKGEIR
ncbi:MAG TPA: acyl carrier protein [Candidatus Pelethenecus sp.]|nr:acyl carrier protein [Candidatus Pelethenecus sp.]